MIKGSNRDEMPWFGWILMYGIIVPLFVLMMFLWNELPWWFVPTCIGTTAISLLLLTVYFKVEETKKQRERRPQ